MGDKESEEDIKSKVAAEGVASLKDGAVEVVESFEDYVERFKRITLKEEAGQIAPAKVVSTLFLHDRFPAWKDDNMTYIIPPVFTFRTDRIGIKGSELCSSQENRGEKMIFDLLEEIGRKKEIGMFVIFGFEMHDIQKWNEKNKSLKVDIEQQFPKEQEFDFIIFHHVHGVISIEVKNDLKYRKESVVSAEKNLRCCNNLIKALAAVGGKEIVPIRHRNVIALPFIAKSNFQFSTVKEDTIVILEEQCKNIAAFKKWWDEDIESPDLVPMTPEVQETYEKVLSYCLMIRHLGPVTITESISTLHQSIKYHSPQKAFYVILERELPHFSKWCLKVLNLKDSEFNFEKAEDAETFLRKHNAVDVLKRIKFLNELMKHQAYIGGDKATMLDEKVATFFDEKYYLFTSNIAKYVCASRDRWNEIEEQSASLDLKKHPFLELCSPKDFNMLDRYLSKSSFVEGDQPSFQDRLLFEKLLCRMRVKHFNLPLVLTAEQLVVFNGPCKQLIIGPPGSGKTELLKFKALELEMKMKRSGEEKKILFLIANGSSGYRDNNSLIFYHIKNFFEKSKSTLVEVFTTLQRGSPEELERTVADLARKIESENYGHVFVDEYWIGFKPVEHSIVPQLIKKIPGYVWITSVFDYNQEKIDCSERMQTCTKPLLESLKQNGGTVNRITQVMRSTNCIINLERMFGNLYQNRSYPYGTRDVLGHSMDGLPITWAAERDVSQMYAKCADIVDSMLKEKNSMLLDSINREAPTFDSADIIIINFAIRIKFPEKIESYLNAKGIPFFAVGKDFAQRSSCQTDCVNLFQSLTREDSAYLDGNEWPVVITILPSNLLLNTAELARDAESLRHYDTYIAFFRTAVKLVIISDKWRNCEEFLCDLTSKSQKKAL